MDGWWRDDVDARSKKPTIAAILMVGAGISELYSAVLGFRVQAPVTDLPINVSGLILFCATLMLVMGVVVTAGAFVAFKRLSFTMAMIATIAGMLGVGPYALGSLMSLIAMVLVALSKEEFRE
jgi:hypothetical protein